MNCKVGDVALIVSPRVASNEGALVEVLASRPRAAWLVRSLDGPRECEDGTYKLEAVALDANLRPVARGKAKRLMARSVEKASARLAGASAARRVRREPPRQLQLGV